MELGFGTKEKTMQSYLDFHLKESPQPSQFRFPPLHEPTPWGTRVVGAEPVEEGARANTSAATWKTSGCGVCGTGASVFTASSKNSFQKT